MNTPFPERKRQQNRIAARSLGPGGSEARPVNRLDSPQLRRVERRLYRVFDYLETLPYIGEDELRDFLFFRGIFDDCLERIDRRVSEGSLRPLDIRGLPGEILYASRAPRVGVFIGSFDPFQMTHLAMALRFLGSEAGEADVLFIVPEGARDLRKPQKTDYDFRFDILRRQIARVFEPFLVPLDIGEGADTIEIVRRLISLHAGSALRLTHLLGSDVLPLAAGLLPKDLEVWRAEALRSDVDLELSLHVGRRDPRHPLGPYAEAVRAMGIRIVVDREVIGTPSSTAFRNEGAISLVLPTRAILSRLELLFRYGMARPWSACPYPGASRGAYEPRGLEKACDSRHDPGDDKPESLHGPSEPKGAGSARAFRSASKLVGNIAPSGGADSQVGRSRGMRGGPRRSALPSSPAPHPPQPPQPPASSAPAPEYEI